MRKEKPTINTVLKKQRIEPYTIVWLGQWVFSTVS